MQNKTKHSHGNGGAYPSGPKSRLAFITINEYYGRIYFSACAVRIFNLTQTGFDIFEQGGSYYFKTSESPQARRLTSHRYAFYRVDRKLVTDLAIFYSGDRPLRLTIEGAEREAPRYLLTKKDELPGKPPQNKTTGGRPSQPVKTHAGCDREIKEAMSVIAVYKQTDFRGRVKTLEIIRAERIVNALENTVGMAHH